MWSWHDQLFRTYVCVVAALLIGGGLILSALQLFGSRRMTSIWQTYRSWWLIVAVILFAIIMGRRGTACLFIGSSLVGFREYANVTGLARDRWMTLASLLGIALLGATLFMGSSSEDSRRAYGIFMTVSIYMTALLILILVLRNVVAEQLHLLALAVLGFIYIGWMFLHIALLASRRETLGLPVIDPRLDNRESAFGPLFRQRERRFDESYDQKLWMPTTV